MRLQRRYVTSCLSVDVTYSRCNNAMSGFGFEHQVVVITDSETYRAAAGRRRPSRICEAQISVKGGLSRAHPPLSALLQFGVSRPTRPLGTYQTCASTP